MSDPHVIALALLARSGARAHARQMFAVDETTAEAIRRALQEGGELSAVAELRRYFPLLTDSAEARLCARTRTAVGGSMGQLASEIVWLPSVLVRSVPA